MRPLRFVSYADIFLAQAPGKIDAVRCSANIACDTEPMGRAMRVGRRLIPLRGTAG